MIDFESLIGRPYVDLLENEFVDGLSYERRVETSLPQFLVHYTFPENGLELTADGKERIQTIFLHKKKCGGFDPLLMPYDFQWSRETTIEKFGRPLESGGKRESEILGKYGPWDRFALEKGSIHFSYEFHSDELELITLMDNRYMD